MPKLKELDAQFLKHQDDGSSQIVTDIKDADGLMLLCPKCYENKGKVGTHSIICWFAGKVPNDLSPKPGRWTPQGTGIDDLSFVLSVGRSPSVLLHSGCKAHFFIINGEIA